MVLGQLAMTTGAFAHGTDHGKVGADSQMKKLHAMMPVFSTATAHLKAALDQQDVAAVESEAGKILAAVPDLKKAKPHKHQSQRKEFVKLSVRMEEQVKTTVGLAKKGDFSGAKKSLAEAEKVCAECHANFRD